MKLGTLGFGALAFASVSPILQDMHEARQQNQNVAWAGTKSAIKNNWQQLAVMGMPRPGIALAGLTLLQMAPPMASFAYGYFQARNNTIRTAALPFSNSFVHSDATYRAQQRGLQSISGSRSYVGSEASVFNQRYVRR